MITLFDSSPIVLPITSAGNNAQNVRNGECRLMHCDARNPTATPCYLKFYNKATTPAPANDTPVVVLYLPANTLAPTPLPLPINGHLFSKGLGVAVVANAAFNDNTNGPAGVIINLGLNPIV